MINTEVYACLKSETLEKLIKNDFDLEISPKESTNFDQIQHYYIQRQLESCVKINRIKQENNDNVMEKDFFIAHLEDFTDKDREYSQCNFWLYIDENEILSLRIVSYKNKKPTFLHQSYAEYFLSIDTFDKIKKVKSNSDEETNLILRESEHFFIRKFLDNLIKNDDLITKLQ